MQGELRRTVGDPTRVGVSGGGGERVPLVQAERDIGLWGLHSPRAAGVKPCDTGCATDHDRALEFVVDELPHVATVVGFRLLALLAGPGEVHTRQHPRGEKTASTSCWTTQPQKKKEALRRLVV